MGHSLAEMISVEVKRKTAELEELLLYTLEEYMRRVEEIMMVPVLDYKPFLVDIRIETLAAVVEV